MQSKLTHKEILAVTEALQEEVLRIHDKFVGREIPFLIAYSLGTNSGEDPMCGGFCAYSAPDWYEDAAMLHHEAARAIVKAMVK